MIGLHDETGVPPKPHRARALAAATFAESGWLHAGMDLEYRPEQDQMARAVATAFSEDACLLFEAGTGVGKSLAYLVPGIIHAIDTGRPLIVSTNTISLQEQLETKDLPLCRQLFSSVPELKPYASFQSAVLLGKSNYLCASRLAHALADRASLFDDEGYSELGRIAAWSETTSSGLRHEMQPQPRAEVWDAVNADSSSCSRRHCDPSRCFYQRARSRIRAANLIIVNHALLFALINAGGAKAEGASAEGRGVLFPDDFIVLDEAHTIPEVAADHFGIALSSYGVDRSLKILYNPRTKRGLLRKRGGPEAQRLTGEALDCAKRFFAQVEAGLLASRPVARKREAGLVDPLMDGPLDALQRLVARVADELEEGRERDELLDQKGRLKAIQASAGEWLNLSDPEHVYWAERSGRRESIITLRSAPIDVAPELRRRLFGCGVGVACTSATLALAGEMAPFAGRMGAEGARTGLVSSPFDFERNMRVYIAADVPPPSPQEARLSLEALADYISFCALRVPGGSLVLFTSHSDLRAVAAALEPGFAAAGRSLLLQGEGASRTELATQMRSLGNAILFGTDSFWTGVDIPGDALAQVIITRLPFDPPDHPVIEARADRIRDNGGSPFNEITLPDALIKFRQGVGRLIRSKTDRGLITILDSRILSKSYGKLFIESLPKQEFLRLTRDNREELFRSF
jgi:ATP-dependent DNA helicase DinG